MSGTGARAATPTLRHRQGREVAQALNAVLQTPCPLPLRPGEAHWVAARVLQVRRACTAQGVRLEAVLLDCGPGLMERLAPAAKTQGWILGQSATLEDEDSYYLDICTGEPAVDELLRASLGFALPTVVPLCEVEVRWNLQACDGMKGSQAREAARLV